MTKFTLIPTLILGATLSAGRAQAIDTDSSGIALLHNCTEALRRPITDDAAFWYCYGVIEGAVGAIRSVERGQGCDSTYLLKTVTTEQVVRIVVRYLTAHPESLHYDQAVLVVLAFSAVFPCPPATR